jgi:hypothetical protein
VLDDGSVWAVDGADQPTAAPWTDASTIHVSQEESGGSGGYVLTDESESVTAIHIGDK